MFTVISISGRVLFSNVRIVVSNAAGIIAVTGLLWLFHLDDVSRITLFIFYVISTVVVSLKIWLVFRILLLVHKKQA